MNRFIKTTGIIGATGLVLSIVFKTLHWMGAPSLLAIGTLGTLLFVVGVVIRKIKSK